MSKSTLVGYKRFTSQKGEQCCVMAVVREASEADKNKGYVGSKVEEIFCPKEQIDLLQPQHVGKPITINYDISGGRAYVDSITLGDK